MTSPSLNWRWKILFLLCAIVIATVVWHRCRPLLPGPAPIPIGTPIDSLDGVVVHHNGRMGNVSSRNVIDGYNVGLRYQCVEFVKRYFLERYDHRMPNSYGHAKDFFDTALADGSLNQARGLLQFRNNSASKPQPGDLLVLDGWKGNPYGHVAIVSKVQSGEIEIVQQNCGTTRETIGLDMHDGKWRLDGRRALGWLRMP